MSIGSFPLTRGTHHIFNFPIGYGRFIPAYAGNSNLSLKVTNSHSVHPRLRGELDLLVHNFRVHAGSSPLTRGTLSKFWQRRPERRFIPAYAGNSQRENSFTLQSTVHPRLRGELPKLLPVRALRVGSSPLTRGTQRSRSRRTAENRFIPAYAGNSRPFLV